MSVSEETKATLSLKPVTDKVTFGRGNISVLIGVHCKDCGWPIIDACCNWDTSQLDTSKPELAELEKWDWWQYCSNKTCKNHHGEGVFQNTPEFVVKD